MSPRSPQSPSALSNSPKAAARAALAGVLLTLTACQDPHEEGKDAVLTTSTGGTTTSTPTSSGGVDTAASSHTTTEGSSTTADTTTSGTTADTTGTSGDSTTTDGTGDTTDTGAVEPPPECTEHTDCASGACKILEGECFSNEAGLVINVDPSDCNPNGPVYCDFNQVLEGIKKYASENYEYTIVFKGNPNLQFIGNIAIPDEYKWDIAILGNGLEVNDTGKLVIHNGPGTLYLDGFKFNSFAQWDAPKVECNGGGAYLTKSWIGGGAGAGVAAENCDVFVDRSVITGNGSEGIEMTNGDLYMANSFVTDNGFNAYGGGGIVLKGVKGNIVYSTVLNNKNITGADSIHLNGGNVSIRNAFVAQPGESKNGSIKGEGIDITHSIVDVNAPEANGNVTLASAVAMGLLWESNPGVYQWKEAYPNPPARWKNGDPEFDFNGNLRPTKDGNMDDPGALIH